MVQAFGVVVLGTSSTRVAPRVNDSINAADGAAMCDEDDHDDAELRSCQQQ